MELHISEVTMDVTREVLLDAALADVWRAVSDAEELSAWFGGDVVLTAVPGAFGTFTDGAETRLAVVESVEHERSLSLRWWPEGSDPDGTASTVRFTLEETDAGTRLTVVETSADAKATAAWAARLVDLELLCLTLQLAPA
jgi:uncharacterized protein YndB with AHSA1/START domain